MKRKHYLSLSILFITLAYSCKVTTIIQSDNVSWQDSFVHSYYPENNYGNQELLQSLCWTISGDTVVLRSFINFDLSAIPVGSKIVKAELSLFEHHTTIVPSQGHSHQSGSNSSYIKRVTSSWEENKITWNNQPATTDSNRVLIPQDTITTQDYLNIDVTNLIQDIINNPEESYGLMICLADESPYKAMYFASANYKDALKQTKLVIKSK